MRSKLIRQTKQLLLSAVIGFSSSTCAIAVIGLWAIPVQAQVSDAQVGKLVEALRLAAQKRAPGNNGLVSEWQILPGNIPRWSRQCTGKEVTIRQFESNATQARQILECVLRDVMQEQYKASGNNEALAVRRVASWWLTGNPNQYNSGSTTAYSQSVLSFYQQQGSNAQDQPPSVLPKPPSSAQSTQAKPSTRTSSPTLISNTQVGKLVEALRLAAQQRASGNNGLVSEWQILPENIPRWSRQCHTQELTPAQFEASPLTARAILVCVMRDVLNEQYKASGNNEALAVRRTASWWLKGDPTQYSSDSVAPYTQNVLAFYQQQSPSSQAQKPVTPPSSAPSSSSVRVSNAQLGRLVEALRQAAPETDNPEDDLYGAWQVKAENIPRWSQQCLGKELTPIEFQDSPVTARSILVCVMRDVFNEQYKASNNDESLAVQRAAAWWMTGDPNQYSNQAIANYTNKVLGLYRDPSQQPAQQQPTFKFFSHI